MKSHGLVECVMSFGDQFEIVQTQISHSLFSKYEAVDYMG